MLRIDGSIGEGGGQILRTALALGLVTGTPFTLEKIRAKRPKSGLLRQHLAAVRAAEAIGARVEGAELGATKIAVHPEEVRPGEYTFAVGTAGSACLVLQAVLPPLLTASGPSRLVLEGGTHNPWAPTFDFIERVFLPHLRAMGVEVEVRLERAGFYPAGGGRFAVEITPATRLTPVELVQRGDVRERRARALISKLPGKIGQRELSVVREELDWGEEDVAIREIEGSPGPGNVLLLEVECEGGREMATGFGQKGVSAETVARKATAELRRYLSADVPVGVRLADQIMIPMAMAGSGVFRTMPLSGHGKTNKEVIEQFLPVRLGVHEEGEKSVRVTIAPVS